MSTMIDHEYKLWLAGEVESRVGYISENHNRLLTVMHETPFEWYVDNDDNRAEDGKALRQDFMLDQGINDAPKWWREYDASFLETTVALATRIALQTDEPVGKWFWKILDNANLYSQTDDVFDGVEVEEIIYSIMRREVNPDGSRGFFPLKNPPHGFEHMEILYQMYSYIKEYYE